MAEGFSAEANPCRVRCIAENLLDRVKLVSLERRLKGFKVFSAEAVATDRSEIGTHGGLMVLAGKELPTAPVDDTLLEAVGDGQGLGRRWVACVLCLRGFKFLVVCVYLVAGELPTSPANMSSIDQLQVLL